MGVVSGDLRTLGREAYLYLYPLVMMDEDDDPELRSGARREVIGSIVGTRQNWPNACIEEVFAGTVPVRVVFTF